MKILSDIPHRIARVAVDGAAHHFDREYSYLVPPELYNTLLPGCRVRVGFGRGDTLRLAIVLALEDASEVSGLKPLAAQLDAIPMLDGEGLMLLRSLKEQTFCTWFDALRLLIPAGLGIVFQTMYAPAGNFPPPEDDSWRAVLEYLGEKKEPQSEQRLKKALSLEDGTLDAMTAAGFIIRMERGRDRVLDEKVTMIRLLDGWESLKLSPKQTLAARFLSENDASSVKELCYYTGVTRAVAEGLRKKGAAEFYDRVQPRNPYAGKEAGDYRAAELSGGQKSALEALALALEQPDKPALLYGVTGSGKTLVYLELIVRVLNSGKGAILLVPEISLTAQTLESFHARFGSRVAVLHSGLSLGERMDEWRRIRDGGADIVVGTRSAVFAPMKNIGLIVIDEEQEHTYKSEKSPRFHARDIAALRCKYQKALLVLASATPSVESYHAAKTGAFHLVEMPGRFGAATLPEVRIVDMSSAENISDTPSLSLPLREELYQNLQRGEQSILLLNRRGHSTLVRCSSCGEVAECPHCSVAMTYHAANDALLCHYCGYQSPRIGSCGHCGSELVRYSGAGTQRLEEELAATYPDARVLRVDMDTTMSKYSHQRLFGAFAAGEYDIMVGTQMVAKGLNFPRVTLVGVLAADQSLYANDFRSFERTFSLLTQVVGRGGRGELGARAIIQTYSPEHPVIELASLQDYPAFFEDEIRSRKIHLYPPYCRMAGIGFVGTGQQETLDAANAFLERLKSLAASEYPHLPLRILGPSPADVLRASGKYRYKLILKCKNNRETRRLLVSLLDWFYATVRRVGIFIDMYYDGI